ncbi:MAG: hypothetical protein JW800_07045 [Candidatus Omnitrophica bacterium]|nr:hypothetical protein [Candidatus Omnitrophota bacterium]
MKKTALFLFIAFFTLCLSGCATTPDETYRDTSGESIQYGVARQLRYEDVPVPNNFFPVPSESLAVESQSARISSMRYKGRADRIRVINFYKANMPTYGWELMNLIEGSQVIMNYSNGDEICTIVLMGEGGDITMTISLSPEDKK